MVYQTRLEIDLDQFQTNIKHITNNTNKSYAFVVKANAYSHGIISIVKELNELKEVKYICVANIIEALQINPYTTKDIWILGDTPITMLEQVYKNDFILSVSNDMILKHVTKNVRVFCNINTGFNRLGQLPNASYKRQINHLEKNPNITILGLFTHLQLLDDNTVKSQINQFKKFTNLFQNNYLISISDSIAFTRYNIQENLVRIGALMYGLTSPSEVNKVPIKPIQTLKTTITNILSLQKDDTVYYHKRTYPKQTKIATIPIGYADGLFRNVSNNQVVTIHSKKCKILSVSMDQSAVDITDVDAKIDDDVILFGQNGISLQEYSEQFNTNKNEILTKISTRVPRIYYKNNKIYNTCIPFERKGIHD